MDIIRKLQAQIKPNNFEFAALSNAYTEVSDLIEYDEVLTPEGITTYADSGGLQVLTRGLDITKKLKEQIYNDQCNYSDFAMCFDELPVRTLGERSESGSSMIDNSGRFFVDTLFQTDGTQTGKNVLHQIQIFKKLHLENKDNKIGTKPHGKVLIILQGRDFKTLREFAWFLHQEIKDEPNWTDYVDGLAIGNTTNIGVAGLTDSILRFQKELDFFPDSIKNNIHILGAGTINKIFAFFLMPETYWNTKDFILSADSTTQTKAMQFGKYITFDGEGKVDVQTGRGVNETTTKITDEIYEFHKNELKTHSMEVQACNIKLADLKLKMKEELANGKTKEDIKVMYSDELHKLEAESFRQHYTQYNEYLPSFFNKNCTKTEKESLRLRDQFSPYGDKKLESDTETIEAQYQYQKRSIFSKYFWTMKMISDYYNHLGAVSTTVKDFRAGKITRTQMVKKMSKLLTMETYKQLVTVNTHAEYMKDDTILSGHPYEPIPKGIQLEQVQVNGKDVSKVFIEIEDCDFGMDEKVYWITDTDTDGVLRGRKLCSITNTKENIHEAPKDPKIRDISKLSAREAVMQLSPYKLPMVPFEEWDLTKYSKARKIEKDKFEADEIKKEIVEEDNVMDDF